MPEEFLDSCVSPCITGYMMFLKIGCRPKKKKKEGGGGGGGGSKKGGNILIAFKDLAKIAWC